MDIFICWWRFEGIIVTTMQLLYHNPTLVSIYSCLSNNFHSENMPTGDYEELSMVKALCRSMLPSQNVITLHGGLSNWQRQLCITNLLYHKIVVVVYD